METKRVRAYILTFSGMTLLYTLRAGYSFSKPIIAKQYNLNSLAISVVDAFQFFGLSIAFMMKYKLFNNIYTISDFKTNGLLMCLFYLLMPIIPLLYSNPTSFYFLLLVSSGLFGFLQFCFQPTLSQ